jgi:hypothetical protein
VGLGLLGVGLGLKALAAGELGVAGLPTALAAPPAVAAVVGGGEGAITGVAAGEASAGRLGELLVGLLLKDLGGASTAGPAEGLGDEAATEPAAAALELLPPEHSWTYKVAN